MKLREIPYPELIAWLQPILTPDELQAAACARQLLAQAQASADASLEEARAVVADLQWQARKQATEQQATAFRNAIAEWADQRDQLRGHLQRYASEVVTTVLHRLSSALSTSERLQVVLDEVLSETLPAVRLDLLVSPASVAVAQDLLVARRASRGTNGLGPGETTVELNVLADDRLSDDEVILRMPAGAQIRCGFEQALNQLLICL